MEEQVGHGSTEQLSSRQLTTSENEFYGKKGLVHTLHGNIYQLKLQMLFLKRALNMGYEFNLGTEVEDAAKFDDIVFKYKIEDDNLKNVICFLQAKHRQDESKIITADDLLKNNNPSDFLLPKYFRSYCEIERNTNFSGYELRDFILCTNVDLDESSLQNSGIITKRSQRNDDILCVRSEKNAKFYKLTVMDRNLYDDFKKVSELNVLVKKLKSLISQNGKLTLNDIFFKLYHVALCEKVFEIHGNGTKYARFRNDFINGNNLSENTVIFRNALKFALGKESDENDFMHKLDDTKLYVSSTFGEGFKLENNPNITQPENLAKSIAQIIIKDPTNIIKIRRSNDIDKLAGHILVRTGEEEDDPQQALIKFRKTFFDDDNNLAGNLEVFKAALKSELENNKNFRLNQLKQCKFKISKFKTCEETSDGKLLLPKLELPNDVIEDEQIQRFFKKLVLAVNQPNEIELGQIIAKEMGDDSRFNLLNGDLVADTFQKTMLNWFKGKRLEKGKEGTWLNRESGQAFLDEMEENIGNLLSAGLSLAYTEKLQAYNIKFQVNSLIQKLKAFLSIDSVSNKVCRIITPEKTRILSAIKVFDALEHLKEQFGFEQYKKDDSYIFKSLRSLLRPKIQKFVLLSFKSEKSHNLLIIHCQSDCTEVEVLNLYEKLFQHLRQEKKKVILLMNQNDSFVEEKLKDYFDTNFEFKEDNINFNDLTDDSKKKLVEKEVTFQGEKIYLNKLIDASSPTETVDAETIVKLIKNKEILLGNKLDDLGEVNDYYIDRIIRHAQVNLSIMKIKEVLNISTSNPDLFVISGAVSGLEGNKNIYVFDSFESAQSKFKELCQRNAECNIHWLKSDSDNITWYKSQGSISNLVRCKIQKTTEHYTSSNARSPPIDDILDDNHDLVIISDTAGMGKSTALTNLSINLKKNDPSLWVFKINLNDHTEVFQNETAKKKSMKSEMSDRDINQVVNFLSKDLLVTHGQPKLQTKLEQRLFKNSFNNNKKIVFLFDGFDEISPDYTEIVIHLLKTLKDYKIKKLFISTRPNMSEELEKELGVFSCLLDPFSTNEQIEFLTKFWTKNLGLQASNQRYEERLKTYAKSISEQICKSINDREQKFIAIPLQTWMVAETFQEDQYGIVPEWQSCKDFLQSENNQPNLPENFPLVKLYEEFSEKKFFKFCLKSKKRRNFSIVGEKRRAHKEYRVTKMNHGMLALLTLFSMKEIEKLLTRKEIKELDILMEEIKSAEHNEGFINQIIDGKPHFIHRTFAEYFASFYIASQILTNPAETLSFIENFLLTASPIFINNIIEELNKKREEFRELEKPLLQYVVTQYDSNENLLYPNFVKSLSLFGSKGWAKKLDANGKTTLMYAIESNRFDIAEKLLDYSNDIYEKDILHHGSFKTEQYANSKLVEFINIEDQLGNTALHYALRNKNLDFAFTLLLQGACIESLTDGDMNKLINKMLYNNDSCDALSRGILSTYADQYTKFRRIEEKLFLKAPNIFKKLDAKDQSRILSYFFVHGRLQVIQALLSTIDYSEQRTKILNDCDNSCTPLDRVNCSNHLTDNERLEMTNYLIDNGATETNFDVDYSSYCINSKQHISRILQASIKYGHVKTFKHFIIQENPENHQFHLRQASVHNQMNFIEYLNGSNVNGNNALHVACDAVNNLKVIRYLIDNGSDLKTENNCGQTPLFMAIFNRSELYVIEYLVSKGADFNHKDETGKTPLFYALQNDQVDIIHYLIGKNARIPENGSQLIKDKLAYFQNPNQYDLDSVDENDSTRLHIAVKSNDIEFASFLMQHGADVNKVDKQGKTPLHWAVEFTQLKMVELLLQYGAFFDIRDSKKKTPCELARVGHSDNKKIVWLLNVLNKLFSSQSLMQEWETQLFERNSLKDWKPCANVDPDDVYDGNNPVLFILNSRNAKRKSLLHIAADTSDEAIMQKLLRLNRGYLRRREESYINRRYKDYQSISIDAVDSEKNSPLHLAARKGDLRIVSFLLEEGVIFNGENEQGCTPEDLANNNNHNEIIELFQAIKNLFTAIKENNTIAIENYTRGAAYFKAKNQDGKSPLHLAASNASLDVVQLLVNDVRVDINVIDLGKNTPLHDAAANDKIENVELLLKCGAIYNAKNAQDQKPLDLAHGQSRKLLEFVDSLFRNILNDDPLTIINAVTNENIGISTIVNVRDSKCNTLLHYAAKERDIEIVRLLLRNGAIYNAENVKNYQPVMLTDDKDISNLLKMIENMFEDVDNIHKADKNVSIEIITNVCNDAGMTLLHRAHQCKNNAMVAWLIKNGADDYAKDRYGHTCINYDDNHAMDSFNQKRFLSYSWI